MSRKNFEETTEEIYKVISSGFSKIFLGNLLERFVKELFEKYLNIILPFLEPHKSSWWTCSWANVHMHEKYSRIFWRHPPASNIFQNFFTTRNLLMDQPQLFDVFLCYLRGRIITFEAIMSRSVCRVFFCEITTKNLDAS